MARPKGYSKTGRDYAKVDVLMDDEGTVARLSDAAFRAYVRGILYCHRHLTDGFIPTVVIADSRRLRRGRAELEAAGLWNASEGGVAVHDYLDWNDSRAEVEARIEAASKAGQRSAQRKVQRSVDDPLNDPSNHPSNGGSNPALLYSSKGSDSLSNVKSLGTRAKATLNEDQTYLAQRIGELWDYDVPAIVTDLLGAFDSATVTEVLRRTWGARPDVTNPSAYLNAACRAVEESEAS